MDDPIASPPRLFSVRQSIDGVHVRMPRRLNTSATGQLWVLLSAFVMLGLLFFGWLLIPLALGILIELGSQGAVAALISAVLGLLLLAAPLVLLIGGYRRVSAPGLLRLNQRMLRLEGHRAVEIPLESVERIEIHAGTERGRLRFVTADGHHDLFDGLFIPELEWLAELVRHHAHRYRATLTEEGHDIAQTARPPRALIELVRR